MVQDTDLYEILEISRSASKDEVRKAYRKLVLKHHPDKVSESEREAADIRFKSISEAYEILYDDQKRELYDQHGMAAFDKSQGPGGPGGAGMDMDDILAQMFGMGMGGAPGGHGRGGMKRPSKGESQEQQYPVTLEDLYKGKTARFSVAKQVICHKCEGRGGRAGAKSAKCSRCSGQGTREVVEQAAPGFLVRNTVICDSCEGTGSVFKDKDKCKKCNSKKTVTAKTTLELYVPRGSKGGDRIVLEGEADQHPDQEPGDIIFVLSEQEHKSFERRGNDLVAKLEVTLAEALCGFSRVVVTHLDGRGIQLTHNMAEGKVLRPGQILKVPGEGMYYKKSDLRGDMFFVVEVNFPEDGFLSNPKNLEQLRSILPKPGPPMRADTVDEVAFDREAVLSTADGDEWQDEDGEEERGGPQCTTQ